MSPDISNWVKAFHSIDRESHAEMGMLHVRERENDCKRKRRWFLGVRVNERYLCMLVCVVLMNVVRRSRAAGDSDGEVHGRSGRWRWVRRGDWWGQLGAVSGWWLEERREKRETSSDNREREREAEWEMGSDWRERKKDSITRHKELVVFCFLNKEKELQASEAC